MLGWKPSVPNKHHRFESYTVRMKEYVKYFSEHQVTGSEGDPADCCEGCPKCGCCLCESCNGQFDCVDCLCNNNREFGELAERLNAPDSKSDVS